MSLEILNNIDINEMLKQMREKQDKQNERQRKNYLKRKQEGRNKQHKPIEEQKKRGPKPKEQLNLTSRNNLNIILASLKSRQDTAINEPIHEPLNEPIILNEPINEPHF
jgi:hypothetical protein